MVAWGRQKPRPARQRNAIALTRKTWGSISLRSRASTVGLLIRAPPDAIVTDPETSLPRFARPTGSAAFSDQDCRYPRQQKSCMEWSP